jgi:ribosomal protein S18 acetylase RimI-like enzyme
MDLEIDKVKIDSMNQNNDVFNFREATVKDRSTYAEIINQTFGDELDDNTLGQLLEDSSVRVYMLEKNGRVIGSTTIQFKATLSVGYIYDVAVMEGYRRQGLGSYMLKNCINVLKVNNMDRASLLVAGENMSALELYHRLGFKEVDIDIIMQKKM